jgi:hypothetical protein
MANGNGLVQRAPLPPLNSPIINEADRTRVYGAIEKQLNTILNGATSYYSDSMKKSSKDLMSELDDLIGAVQSLRDVVNDPGNILGDAVRPAPGSINSVNAKQSTTVPPSQIEGISEALNSQPVRRLSRINGNNPPVSAFDTGAPATQFALPDNPGPLGGLAGRIAAMAGIDPRNPDRLVPPPGGLLGLYLSGLR